MTAAAAPLFFDAETVAPRSGNEPIPGAWYVIAVAETEVKDASSGQGNKYLQLTWEVLEGQNKGRKVWQRLNLWNTNKTAVEIAQGELSAICHAVGTLKLTHPDVLRGKPCRGRVIVKPAKDGYDATNEIKGFEALGAGGPALVTASRTAVAPAPLVAAPVGPAASQRPAWSQGQ